MKEGEGQILEKDDLHDLIHILAKIRRIADQTDNVRNKKNWGKVDEILERMEMKNGRDS